MARGKLLPFRRQAAPPAPLESETLSDEALLAACAVGDGAALGLLFDRHARAVFRFLSRLLPGQPSDVEDLAQLTFLEAWRAASGFGGRGSGRSFLLGIAANLVRHHVRGQVRRRRAMSTLADEPTTFDQRPDVLVERDELLDRLQRALALLPHPLRVVYVMCEIEEVPGVEAARALGLRQGTLWRRLHLARRALRDAIEGRTP